MHRPLERAGAVGGIVSFGRELASLGDAARAEIRYEQRAVHTERLRETVETHLRDLGSRVADLSAESVETLRKELDAVWERMRQK